MYITNINVTQMMLGKQGMKSWGMYKWAAEAYTYNIIGERSMQQ